MLSIDTNLLLFSVVEDHEKHAGAIGFLRSVESRQDVAISEFLLIELYNLLRNPTVMGKPLSPAAAVETCAMFRNHPTWQLVGFPPESRRFHNDFWPKLAERSFARRRAFDWRMALSLIRHGVTEFATENVRDFQDFGFARVWNPLGEAST